MNMQIKFLSCKKEPIECDFEYNYNYACVKNQQELNSIGTDFIPIPSIAFSIKKILERNCDFNDFIQEMNKSIPFCPSSEKEFEWEGIPSDIACFSPQALSVEIWSELEKKGLGENIITKKYKMHSDLKDHLPFLIKAHALMLPFCRPDFEIDFKAGEGLYGHFEMEGNLSSLLSISIGTKTTVNKIIENLKKNKKMLDEYLSKLEENPWYISPKALAIYDLREKGKKFREVADIVGEKYDSPDEYDGRTNENSVKKSYTRTADIIHSMFSKKVT